MTDTSQDIPQPVEGEIHWWESQIVIKQIVVALFTVLGAGGIAIAPERQAQIISGIVSLATLAGVTMTIVDRIRKPCPTIKQKGTQP